MFNAKVRPVYNRRGKATALHAVKVEIEIAFSRTSRKYITTDIALYPDQWDGGIIVNHRDAQKLNKQLTALIKEHEETLRDIHAEGKKVDKEEFDRRAARKRGDTGDDFIDFAYSVMDTRGLRESTVRQHRTALEALRAFGGIRTFDDLTPANVARFDRWLRQNNPGLLQTTIHNYHKRIAPYINEAVATGLVEESPYLRWHSQRGKPRPREALTEGELRKVRALEIDDPGMAKARDIFLFSCFTGMAYADTMEFDYGRDSVESGGMRYIDGERMKTGTKFYTPLLPPALEILEKYGYRLPRMTQQACNRQLKYMAMLIGTKKRITTHIARYTFATTVALAHGVPIECVAKMLGHTNIQVTQLYAKVMNTAVEKQARRLAEII